MSTRPTLTQFNKIAPLLIQQYQTYLPNAFDETLSILEKVNLVIKRLHELGEATNGLIEKWNEVMEWVMNDGLNEAVINKLDEMVADGTMDEIINHHIFNELNTQIKDLGDSLQETNDNLDITNDLLDDTRLEMATHNELAYINVARLGVNGTDDDSATMRVAVDDAILLGYSTLYIPYKKLNLSEKVDCKQLNILGNDTEINGDLDNVASFKKCYINGIRNDVGQSLNIYPTTSVTTKLVDITSEENVTLFTKKPNNNGYLQYILQYGVPSVYEAGELLRPIKVRNIVDIVVYRHTRRASSVGNWEEYNYDLVSPYTARQPIRFWRNSSPTAGDKLDITINVPDSGEFTLGFLTTASSDPNASVLVDGVEIAKVDLATETNGVYAPKFYAKSGERTISIVCSQNAKWIYCCGANFYHLKDTPTNIQMDSYAWWRNDRHYIENSGATDYAIRDYDSGHFVGSYHGYEQLIDRKLIIDGSPRTTTNVRILCESVVLEQDTLINGKLNSHTVRRWVGDGVEEFTCSMEGDMNVSTFYTAMTTSHYTFTDVVYPIQLNVSGMPAVDIKIGRTQMISQVSPTTNQRITTIFTLFDDDNNKWGGSFMKHTEGGNNDYNKIYYGKVIDSFENIKQIAFQTTRIYE